MSYDEFKQKLGVGARPSIFEVVCTVPKEVAEAVGSDQKTVTDQMKFFVSATQVPSKTIGQVTVTYQGEEVKLGGDVTYDDITYTYLSDVDYFVRQLVDKWTELIVDPTTNARGVPNLYKQEWFVYQVSNEVDGNGNKVRVAGWKLIGGFPTTLTAHDKNWETKDAIESSTFTLRYDKYKRVNAQGQEI